MTATTLTALTTRTARTTPTAATTLTAPATLTAPSGDVGFAALARAIGAPGPTLVLDADALPRDSEGLVPALTRIRRRLADGNAAGSNAADGDAAAAGGRGEVLKWALIAPSAHPLFDVDYRFVQAMPDAPDHFDLTGNCGHSLLAAVTAAAQAGRLPALRAGDRIRARVLNNGDQVVCQVDHASSRHTVFTAHFIAPPGTRLGSLLRDGGRVVRMANPYLFVDGARLGVRDREALFRGDQPELYATLERMRRRQAARLGWPLNGAFPKVAAVVPVAPGHLAVRALTVGGWHPELALTGAVCLAAASALRGTIPNRLLAAGDADASSAAPGRLVIDTPARQVVASYAATGDTQDDELLWVSVGGKETQALGAVAVGVGDE
ncbi:PrpF domain-containing protein [Streptacidiphilus anmyonensis]|uniref:PrpF domain-containing protein n=1 Tax=Streptacidiphilus anmyonensis TaxID=405782 RepID=UPI00069350A0|nr:PrpF domain-containing protein [Streptacidiphilus anmyonensis]